MPYSLLHTLNISRKDLLSRLKDLDVTSHNLANVNTTGYKTNRANFQEVLNGQLKEGNQLKNTQLIQTPGTLTDSENPLDLAIVGEGFFSVTLPNGDIGYTRDGQFRLDAERTLVTAEGYPVDWEGEIPEGTVDVQIQSNGTVMAVDEEGASKEAGTIELTRFPNSSGLAGYGDNVWLATDSSGEGEAGAPGEEGFGSISSRKIEGSNVDLGRELAHLMTLQRSFSMSLAAFQQTDTMISEAINLRKG